MNTPYYQNAEVRRKIDEVLRMNARMRTNLGKDSSADEVARAKKVEQRNLKRVNYLDPEKVDIMLLDD